MMLLLSGFLHAQAQGSLHSITTESNGLSYNNTVSILPDSHGDIWIGTCSGLNRWSGRKIEIFSKFPEKHFFLNYISALEEDSEGNIWIGTEGGVLIYNSLRGKFRPLSSVCKGQAIPSDRILTIHAASDGIIWIGSRGGPLYSWDGKNLQEWKDIHYICHIMDKDGAVWATSFSGHVFRLQDGNWIEPFPDLRARDILPYREKGKILIVREDGLWEWDTSVGVSSRLVEAKSLSAARQSLSGTSIYYVDGACVCRYDCLTAQVTVITNSLPDKTTRCIREAKDGTLWLTSTRSGALWLRTDGDPFRNYPVSGKGPSMSESYVSGFAPRPDGKVWVSTEHQGLFLFDPATESTEHYPLAEDIPRWLNDVASDGQGLWLATQKGLFRVDGKTSGHRQYHPEQVFYCLYRSRAGYMYAGGSDCLVRYNPANDAFDTLDSGGNLVGFIREDKDGRLWMASYASGLLCFDAGADTLLGAWSTRTADPISPIVSSVQLDSAGGVWAVGFNDGLSRNSGFGTPFRHFTRKNSAVRSDVFFIAQTDRNGYVWFASMDGIYRYDAFGDSFRLFTQDDGLETIYFRKAGCTLPDGTIVFGHDDGFIAFNPEKLSSSGEELVFRKEKSIDILFLAVAGGILLLCLLAAIIGIRIFWRRKASEEEQDVPDNQFRKELEELIAARMDDPEFGVQDIEQALNVSRSTLTRRIRQYYGLTPVEYLRDERLNEAARLLKSGVSPIRVSEVGYAVGFDSPSYFSRSFKQRFGCTPSQYRQSS